MLATCATLLLALPLQLTYAPESIQPRTLASPSIEWTLRTEPSSKFGDGPSHLAVSRGGEPVWAADLPFTLWEAQISDAGQVAGYAFTTGRKDGKQMGDFIVALFAPDGRELLHESVARTGSRFLHRPPNPDPRGLFVHSELDRFVVRVADEDINRAEQEWWIYRLSTGESLGRVRPQQLLEAAESLGGPLDARPIPGTPLTLVQWFQVEGRETGAWRHGTRFVLVGEDLTAVWTHALAGDYWHADETEADRRRNEAREKGGILAVEQAGRFELRHVAANERVTYEVVAEPGETSGWVVREVARAPGLGESDAPMPQLALRKLATVPLQAGAARIAGPVHDLEAFDFDGTGRVRCVRRDETGGFSLLSLDPDGSVAHEVRVAVFAPETEGTRAWHALGDDRWLFTLSPYGDGVSSRAWFVDEASGAASEIDGFAGPSVAAVRPAPQGGFVVLGSRHGRYSMSAELIAFDHAGARRWEVLEQGYDGEDSSLLGPNGVAVEADGSVLVLDNVRALVQVFDASGRFERAVELAEAVGAESYLTDLRVDAAGQWLVCELDSTPVTSPGSIGDVQSYAWHRIDREGRLLASLTLRGEDGRDRAGVVRVDPRGRLWTTDGDALYEADADGVLRRRFGEAADAEELEEPTGVRFDGRGRIAVIDRRSRSIHVFGAEGARELLLRPEPADIEDAFPRIHQFIATPGGHILLQVEHSGLESVRHLEFAPDGRRVGWVEVGGDRVELCPDGGRWLGRGSQYEACHVTRLGAGAEPGVTLTRRPNGDFFLSIEALGCGPDGALSVLTGVREGVVALDLYSPVGEPQRSIALDGAPRGYWDQICQSDRWLVVSAFTNEAVVVNLASGQASLVREDASAEGKSCAFSLSPDGAELWCATLEPLALHRYALPE